MYKKAALSIAFVALLVFTYSVYIGSLDIRSYFFFSPSSSSDHRLPPSSSSSSSSCAPLRVYMYDLPRRFHMAMMDHSDTDDAPVTAANLPHWPPNKGLRKQHSVEYWMMASLLWGEENEGWRRLGFQIPTPRMCSSCCSSRN